MESGGCSRQESPIHEWNKTLDSVLKSYPQVHAFNSTIEIIHLFIFTVYMALNAATISHTVLSAIMSRFVHRKERHIVFGGGFVPQCVCACTYTKLQFMPHTGVGGLLRKT